MARPFVIFDFDGTVADSFVESLKSYNRVAPRLHLRQVAEAEVPELRRMSAGVLMRTLGIPMWKLPRLMIAVRADLHENFHCVEPVPGIGKAISELTAAGCDLGIVTSNSEENVRIFLSRHGIEGFQTIVAGSSIFGKATRLRRLMNSSGHPNPATVYVGDTAPDIRAAREAGAAAIAVAWGFSDTAPLNEECPDALCESAAQLTEAISRLVGAR